MGNICTEEIKIKPIEIQTVEKIVEKNHIINVPFTVSKSTEINHDDVLIQIIETDSPREEIDIFKENKTHIIEDIHDLPFERSFSTEIYKVKTDCQSCLIPFIITKAAIIGGVMYLETDPFDIERVNLDFAFEMTKTIELEFIGKELSNGRVNGREVNDIISDIFIRKKC